MLPTDDDDNDDDDNDNDNDNDDDYCYKVRTSIFWMEVYLDNTYEMMMMKMTIIMMMMMMSLAITQSIFKLGIPDFEWRFR